MAETAARVAGRVLRAQYGRAASTPPSTTRFWPVIQRAAGDARNRHASAMSSGSPRRPSGTRDSQRSTPSGQAFSMPALWISPGETELTRMPERPELLGGRPGERQDPGLGAVVVAVVAGRVRR